MKTLHSLPYPAPLILIYECIFCSLQKLNHFINIIYLFFEKTDYFSYNCFSHNYCIFFIIAYYLLKAHDVSKTSYRACICSYTRFMLYVIVN